MSNEKQREPESKLNATCWACSQPIADKAYGVGVRGSIHWECYDKIFPPAAPAQPVPPSDDYCWKCAAGTPHICDAIKKAAPSPVLTQPSAETGDLCKRCGHDAADHDFEDDGTVSWCMKNTGNNIHYAADTPCKCKGFIPKKSRESERPVLPVPPSVEDLQLAKALHINYCEDLSGEGQAWEVPAEDEPEYFETLAEAIVFLHELPDKESESAISQLAQVCNELKDEVKLLRASSAAVAHMNQDLQLENKLLREKLNMITDFVNNNLLADRPDVEEDGFGGGAVNPCLECGLKLMEVVRPGKVQCSLCG